MATQDRGTAVKRRLAIGVDGGNTKTVAVVGALDGTVLGVGWSGCSNIYGASSASAALAELNLAIDGALGSADAERGDVEVGVFSLAGADWPEDYQYLEQALCRDGFRGIVRVYNDAIGALRAGSPDFIGVAAVCGTGATTGARSPEGQVWHTSWWQETQGSKQLGQKALWAAYRAEPGIGPPTSLVCSVLETYDHVSVEDLLHTFTARQRPPHAGPEPAGRVLVRDAERGDPVATAILTAHGRELGDYAFAAARQVGIERDEFPLVLAGTVLRRSELLASSLVSRTRELAPGATTVVAPFEPVVGAFFLALASAGVRVPGDVMGRVERSLATDPPLSSS